MKRILAVVLIISFVLFIPENAVGRCSGVQSFSVSGKEETLSLQLSKNKISEPDISYILDACRIGIADYSLAANPKDKISISDLVKLYQKAYYLRYGKESKYLSAYIKNMSSLPSFVRDGKANRYHVAELTFFSTGEIDLDIKYKTFPEFVNHVIDYYDHEEGIYKYPNSAIMIKNKDGTVNTNAQVWASCTDIKAINSIGVMNAVEYVLRAFDRANGERVMTLYADASYRPMEKIDVKTAILAVYHYYGYLMPEPKNVVVEKVGTYNKDIITDALLKKSTSLPEATNQKLPKWKGFNVDHLSCIAVRALSDLPEYWVYEADIKTIAQTGANFVNVRISWGCLSAPDYVSDDTVNINYLESLDRILAWGIKYGVHIQFCFTEGPAMKESYNMSQAAQKTHSVFTDKKYRELNTRYFRMLAKRYAKIDNRYLSFCLMNEPDPLSEKNYAATIKPMVEAIWEESPGRVILADIHSNNCNGEEIAAMGVALCYHHYSPGELFVLRAKAAPIDYKDYYRRLFVPEHSIAGTLYSEEGAGWTWEGKADTSALGGKADIIKGQLSGTLEIMIKDSTTGEAALLIKADGKVIYNDVPVTICDGDRKEDVCYSKEPTVIKIPDGTTTLEISCSKFIISLASVKIIRKDGIEINIPAVTDGFQGMDMSTVIVHEDGSYESDHITENQLYMEQKNYQQTILECKAIADKHGVGFMCGEFGFFEADCGTLREAKIPYQDLTKILTSVIGAFDQYDIPWCGEYRATCTLTNSYPLNSNTTYKDIIGSSLYLDMKMNEFYKKIIK